MTRMAFSHEIGYPLSSISNWVHKEKPVMPNAEALLDIADYFGVSVDELYEDPEEEDEESI
jgi:transcriptional regulator with XRE-family HTH domain